MAYFLISSLVLGLLGQLQIFLIPLSDRIAGAFNRSGATQAAALDTLKGYLHYKTIFCYQVAFDV